MVHGGVCVLVVGVGELVQSDYSMHNGLVATYGAG